MRRAARRLAKRIPAGGLGGIVWLVAMLVAGCSGEHPAVLGVSAGRFPPCPSSPNCVTSDRGGESHWVAPFALAVPATEGWPAAARAAADLQGARIAKQTETYLHVECSSPVLGFVDDLELHLRPADRSIAVRSASRIGYWDLGANRRRVEQLRRLLMRSGTIH